MAHPIRARIAPSVPLSLELREDDGSTLRLDFRLAFNFNALSEFEKETGVDVLGGDIFRKVNAKTISALFWASLLAHQPEYAGADGLAVVRSYMDAGNAAEITKSVMEAFILSLPADQQEAVRQARLGNPTGPATVSAGTPPGSGSGPAPDTISISEWRNSPS